MSDRISPTQERVLKERLHREATETWPEFSEPLHDRIMSTVERRRAKQMATASGVRDVLRRPARLWAALAAACLLGIIAFGWRLSVQQNISGTEDGLASMPAAWPFEPWSTEPVSAGQSAMDLLAVRNLDDLNDAIVSTAVAAQRDDLEHDIRRAAEAMLERLPVNVELVAGP